MKTIRTSLTLVTIFAFHAVLSSAQTVKDGYPTQEARKGSQEEVIGLGALLMARGDFRTLFATRPTIEDRVARGVCVFDGLSYDKGCVEVAIGSGASLQAVLEKVGMGDWHGGPQIKVIKKDEIVQNCWPAMSPEAKRKSEEFLKTRVAPGDFVYLPPIT